MELFKPEIGLVFWMFVVAVILVVLLGKYAWPGIIKGLEERADLIDKGVEYAQQAKENLDNAQAEAQKLLDQAKREQTEILREADRLKAQMIEEARGAAAAEAKKVTEQAQLAIDQARKQAELQFRDEVSAFALSIAEKVMRANLSTDDAQARLVDKLIDEVEHKN